jgi:cyanophycinase-like exopeptidase
MDKTLLSMTDVEHPQVAIVPTAADEYPQLAARNGVTYFENLGAKATATMILQRSDAEQTSLVQVLRDSDVLYLTGGNPVYLLQTLVGTLAEDAIREHLRRGKIVVGSSAGAMLLADKMASRRLDWQKALGLVPRLGLLPHFEDIPQDEIDARREELEETVVLLAVDTATCCVGPSGDGDWQVLGEGRVGLYTASGEESIYRAGEQFTLNTD